MPMPDWFPPLVNLQDDWAKAQQEWDEYVHDMETMYEKGEI